VFLRKERKSETGCCRSITRESVYHRRRKQQEKYGEGTVWRGERLSSGAKAAFAGRAEASRSEAEAEAEARLKAKAKEKAKERWRRKVAATMVGVMAEFRRKRNRLGARAYEGRGAYFLTICTEGRKKLLGDSELVDRLLGVLRKKCAVCFFDVYAYCFMPDHLHLVVIGESDSASLPRFMQAFKSLAARETARLGIAKPWQKGFYDHVLVDGESIDSAALYAFLNPVRANLVRRAEEWPYSGSFLFAWPNVPVISTAFVPPWKKEAHAEPKKEQEEKD